MKNIIYLACPYTDVDTGVRLERFEIATSVAASLIQRGLIVFSPITMTHPIDIVLAGSAGTLGSDFWVRFDEAFMDACSEMLIVDINGWRNSEGIKREVKYFSDSKKRIRLISPSGDIGISIEKI